MSEQCLTITLPQGLYAALERRAARQGRSVAAEVVASLSELLAPAADSSSGLADLVAALPVLDDATLWRLARARVAAPAAARLATLGDQGQQGLLTAAEHQEALALSEHHDLMLVLRAEAAVLLRQRGHEVSSLLSGASSADDAADRPLT